MSLCDEEVDPRFVLREERMNVVLVGETGALSLGEDEVGEEYEAEVGVERRPGDGESFSLGSGWGEY